MVAGRGHEPAAAAAAAAAGGTSAAMVKSAAIVKAAAMWKTAADEARRSQLARTATATAAAAGSVGRGNAAAYGLGAYRVVKGLNSQAGKGTSSTKISNGAGEFVISFDDDEEEEEGSGGAAALFSRKQPPTAIQPAASTPSPVAPPSGNSAFRRFNSRSPEATGVRAERERGRSQMMIQSSPSLKDGIALKKTTSASPATITVSSASALKKTATVASSSSKTELLMEISRMRQQIDAMERSKKPGGVKPNGAGREGREGGACSPAIVAATPVAAAAVAAPAGPAVGRLCLGQERRSKSQSPTPSLQQRPQHPAPAMLSAGKAAIARKGAGSGDERAGNVAGEATLVVAEGAENEARGAAEADEDDEEEGEDDDEEGELGEIQRSSEAAAQPEAASQMHRADANGDRGGLLLSSEPSFRSMVEREETIRPLNASIATAAGAVTQKQPQQQPQQQIEDGEQRRQVEWRREEKGRGSDGAKRAGEMRAMNSGMGSRQQEDLARNPSATWSLAQRTAPQAPFDAAPPFPPFHAMPINAQQHQQQHFHMGPDFPPHPMDFNFHPPLHLSNLLEEERRLEAMLETACRHRFACEVRERAARAALREAEMMAAAAERECAELTVRREEVGRRMREMHLAERMQLEEMVRRERSKKDGEVAEGWMGGFGQAWHGNGGRIDGSEREVGKGEAELAAGEQREMLGLPWLHGEGQVGGGMSSETGAEIVLAEQGGGSEDGRGKKRMAAEKETMPPGDGDGGREGEEENQTGPKKSRKRRKRKGKESRDEIDEQLRRKLAQIEIQKFIDATLSSAAREASDAALVTSSSPEAGIDSQQHVMTQSAQDSQQLQASEGQQLPLGLTSRSAVRLEKRGEELKGVVGESSECSQSRERGEEKGDGREEQRSREGRPGQVQRQSQETLEGRARSIRERLLLQVAKRNATKHAQVVEGTKISDASAGHAKSAEDKDTAAVDADNDAANRDKSASGAEQTGVLRDQACSEEEKNDASRGEVVPGSEAKESHEAHGMMAGSLVDAERTVPGEKGGREAGSEMETDDMVDRSGGEEGLAVAVRRRGGGEEEHGVSKPEMLRMLEGKESEPEMLRMLGGKESEEVGLGDEGQRSNGQAREAEELVVPAAGWGVEPMSESGERGEGGDVGDEVGVAVGDADLANEVSALEATPIASSPTDAADAAGAAAILAEESALAEGAAVPAAAAAAAAAAAGAGAESAAASMGDMEAAAVEAVGAAAAEEVELAAGDDRAAWEARLSPRVWSMSLPNLSPVMAAIEGKHSAGALTRDFDELSRERGESMEPGATGESYEAWDFSHPDSWQRLIDPHGVLCRFQFHGRCLDDACEDIHLDRLQQITSEVAEAAADGAVSGRTLSKRRRLQQEEAVAHLLHKRQRAAEHVWHESDDPIPVYSFFNGRSSGRRPACHGLSKDQCNASSNGIRAVAASLEECMRERGEMEGPRPLGGEEWEAALVQAASQMAAEEERGEAAEGRDNDVGLRAVGGHCGGEEGMLQTNEVFSLTDWNHRTQLLQG